MQAPRGDAIRSRQSEAEARLSALPAPGQPTAVVGRHAMRQRQAQADPLGLARDERLAQANRPARAAAPRPVSATTTATSSPVAVASSRTVPPGPAASIAFRVRFRSAARTPDGSTNDHQRPAAGRVCERLTRACWHAGSTRKATSATIWPRSQGSAGPPLDLAEREQPLDLLLGHRQLPQGDAQALVAVRGRMPPGVELHAHPGARQRVPQLMGQAGRELRQQPRPLGLADRPLHLAEPDAQVVDRPREVSDLVLLAAGASSRKSPSTIRATWPCTPTDPRRDAMRDPARGQDHHAERAGTEHQGRHRGLPPRLPPARLGVEHQERRAPRSARRTATIATR